MKKCFFNAVSLFFFLLISNSASAKPEPKINDLEYAGAIYYELGEHKTALDNTKFRPMARVWVCIKRDQKPISGSFQLSFDDIGVPPVEKRVTTHEGFQAFYLNSVEVHYQASGLISDLNEYAQGHIIYESFGTEYDWETLDSNLLHPLNSLRSKPSDFEDYFAFDITQGMTVRTKTQYYNNRDKNYYIKSSLLRVDKREGQLHFYPKVCELQKKEVIIEEVAGL